jgi:hypothetical protein
MRLSLALVPIALIAEGVGSTAATYPEGETIQVLGYNAVEILEREEAFATMMTALIDRIIPIAYKAAEVAAKQLTVQGMKDLRGKVEEGKKKLVDNKSFVSAQLVKALEQMSTLLSLTPNDLEARANVN